MRLLQSILLLFVLPAYATATLAPKNIPFNNFTLKPNHTIQVHYSFGIHEEIFCYADSTEQVGRLFWPFKGKTYSHIMPVLLKTKSDFNGKRADPTGTIKIENHTAQPIVTSCVFGF